MNYFNLDTQKENVYPALLLDDVLSRGFRKIIRKVFFWCLIVLGGLLFIVQFFDFSNIYLLRSVFVLFGCGYVMLQLLEAMYRSYYFRESDVDIQVLTILNKFNVDVTTLDPVNPVFKKDITKAFLEDSMGCYTMYRLGFSQQDIDLFLKNKTDIVTVVEFEIIENNDKYISFSEFGYSLIHFDSDFVHFLRNKGVNLKDFKQALDWVSTIDKKIKNNERWWTKDSLHKIPSIGKNLAFGQIYELERFGHSIMEDVSYRELGDSARLYQESVDKIESVLVKDTGGNILLTAREGFMCMSVVAALGKNILNGTVSPYIEKKRIYVLDVNMLISSYDEKAEFEEKFQNIMIQASNAGNVILVLPLFADFVQNTHALGTDVRDLVAEFLRSSNLQIILTSGERSYHEVIETDLDLTSHFDKIQLEEFDELHAIYYLQNEVQYQEQKFGVFFTYQAVRRIVESADRYFSDTAVSTKSIDILQEIVGVVTKQGKMVIKEDDIDQLVASKTGISLGKIDREESEKFATLTEDMKKRVIGQDLAVEAVCNAMIRARSGLANPKRPLASFLFVGPTGVGKTETAKALAALYFDDEEKMVRSDMSEYSVDGSLERMIGSPHEAGVFASKIREAAHGVLLLDEFEKASSEVHDLFLQIIDEGFFTDGRGEKVTMRNFIIIATSNAGSELMYEQPIGESVEKDKLLSYIIEKQIFRTELLNRFDDVVLFQTLQEEQVNSITKIMIQKFIERLDERGIILKETPDLITYLSKVGYSSKFGAREINRVIVREIESKVAQAIVLGDLFEGDTISFVKVQDRLEIQKYS